MTPNSSVPQARRSTSRRPDAAAPRNAGAVAALAAPVIAAILTSGAAAQDHYFIGEGDWLDPLNWDLGVPPDNSHAIVNGNCLITADIATQNTQNPGRITIGQNGEGRLVVAGGVLSGAHGGNSGIFVGEGFDGNGTLIIEEGAVFRSQGGGMNVRVGDDLGAVGFVSVAGELQNYKFFEIVNGTLEMQPTGINSKFNENNPSFIGTNGTLAFVIDGDQVGKLARANTNGLHLTIDPGATLAVTLAGDFAINDSWTLIEYTSLVGTFEQGTEFTNQQGFTLAVEYGAGFDDAVVLTLISDDQRPRIASFTADPPSVSAGQAVTLAWSASNFDDLSITPAVGGVTGETGSVEVMPTETTTYTLIADRAGVEVTAEVTVVVDELPEIAAFTTSADVIAPGGEAVLSWSVAGATSVAVEPGIGALPAEGTRSVSPAETTTYVLTATNATGSVTAEATVTVDAIAAALIHEYDPSAPGQSSGALLDGIGNSNFDVRNGMLVTPIDSPNTSLTAAHETVNKEGNDGGDNGDGFPGGDTTYELWVKPGELTEAPEVIFETGGGSDGMSILIDTTSVRLLNSTGGIQTIDIAVPLLTVDYQSDFIQITASLDDTNDHAELHVRGAAGGAAVATADDDIGIPNGRASIFSWSGFAGAALGSLGGAPDVVPDGLRTYRGQIALIRVYDRALGAAEIEEAFLRIAMDPGPIDSDGDLLPDWWEIAYFGDLAQTGAGDPDSDQLDNAVELVASTNPTLADTDMDGLTDKEELDNVPSTNPVVADTDGDVLLDGEEVNGMPATDPTLADTDGDLFLDSFELADGSDPNDINDVPDRLVGVVPTYVRNTPGTFETLANLMDATVSVTFRVAADLAPKADGEREILFETGGASLGVSLVYEAPDTLVARSSGNSGLALIELFHPLTQGDLDGGPLELVVTYDSGDGFSDQVLSLFVGGRLVASESLFLGGTWAGGNGSSFGAASTNLAGDGNNGALTGVAFTSGTLDLRFGFAAYQDALYRGSGPDGPFRITAIEFADPLISEFRLTWTSDPSGQATYSVDGSTDGTTWRELDDSIPSAGAETTASVFPDEPEADAYLFRVRRNNP